MKNQHTKRQHYVSEFLLRQFTYDGSDAYVLDKEQNNKIFNQNVHNICYKKDLYEQKWDDSNEKLGTYVLDNQIENSFAKLEVKVSVIFQGIIEVIRAGECSIDLSNQEMECIAEFVTTLYLRHPYVMNSILEYYDGVENEGEVKNLLDVISYLFEKMELGSAQSLFEYSKKAGIFNKDIEDSPCYVELGKMKKMPFVFWYSKDIDFVTASFPFYISSFDGRNFQRIVFPIAYDVAIVFFDAMPYLLKQGMVLEPEKKNVEEDMKCFVRTYSEKLARFYIARDEAYLERLIRK
ncbi:DUF4238 domain-containing protein [Butyrivibrio fibrisolvens]|uniref:DUF4238 domain-containing protein n=1 Tax=Butyrivibrio fibrisolvens TaxID=831 RepID=UPI0004148858|nr:DUF4238 domain-containing protein [Butyrivibrio fibrisolvens]